MKTEAVAVVKTMKLSTLEFSEVLRQLCHVYLEVEQTLK